MKIQKRAKSIISRYSSDEFVKAMGLKWWLRCVVFSSGLRIKNEVLSSSLQHQKNMEPISLKEVTVKMIRLGRNMYFTSKMLGGAEPRRNRYRPSSRPHSQPRNKRLERSHSLANVTPRMSEECIKQVSLEAIEHFVNKAIGFQTVAQI